MLITWWNLLTIALLCCKQCYTYHYANTPLCGIKKRTSWILKIKFQREIPLSHMVKSIFFQGSLPPDPSTNWYWVKSKNLNVCHGVVHVGKNTYTGQNSTNKEISLCKCHTDHLLQIRILIQYRLNSKNKDKFSDRQFMVQVMTVSTKRMVLSSITGSTLHATVQIVQLLTKQSRCQHALSIYTVRWITQQLIFQLLSILASVVRVFNIEGHCNKIIQYYIFVFTTLCSCKISEMIICL